MPKDIFGYKAYSISEYLAMPNTPQPYLMEALLFKHGKTVLVGKPKTGKSWLALKIGLSVARGEPLFNLKINPSYVLFLEFDRRFLLTSIHEIARGKHTDNMSIISAQAIPLNDDEGYKFLLSCVIKGYSYGDGQLLVIIDHKTACFAGKENEDQPNRKWLDTLDKVHKVHPLSYLVLCQAPKGWKGDVVDLPFGSRLLTAWADTVIFIQRAGKDARRLEMVSNYGEIDPVTYTKDFQIITSGITEESKLEMAKAAIHEQWEEYVYPNITNKVEEIAEKLDISYTTAWAAYNEVKNLMKAKKTDEQNEDTGAAEGNDEI